ncbi:MAG: hypothetical protein JXA30_19065, partial [Deltaproteobacteria bacterium]|nr:hypothetical protein [Deltaproteobacteria bacterium]
MLRFNTYDCYYSTLTSGPLVLRRVGNGACEIAVSVQGSNKSAANSPVIPSARAGPARMVLAVPDEPARGRKPVLRDELAVV